MSSLIQIYQGSKGYSSKELFQKVTFAINTGEHIGVIGPNGAGKTTLFRILTGQETLDSGELMQSQGLRLGYLAQHDQWDESETVEEYLSNDCITPIWELKAIGRGLGLADFAYNQPISSLSGGYRMRCKLLHLIGEESDLLLLDEPTNYLDLESLIVLEQFLQSYSGAFLLISHDREFLRKTTNHILEIEAGDIIKYNGSLNDYFEQKEMLRTQLEARALSIEDKRNEILDFARKFGAKASKARQAQSRLKTLHKLEKIEIKALPNSAIIHLPPPIRAGKQILNLKEVNFGYEKNIVLNNINFTLNRGDHLVVVGVNGVGKSTFLKGLARQLLPLEGEIKYGHEVSIGYYAQHVSESLHPEDTVFEAMGSKAHDSVKPQEIQDLAGALLFSGDDINKKISVLSGGEKSRVSLGKILLQKAPCLLLDEPTNHLDFQSVESLTQALTEYKGTLIVVSHDRSFMSRVGNKVLEIRDGQVEYYHGSYDDYVWSCQKGLLSKRKKSGPKSEKQAKTKQPNQSKFNYKNQKKALEKEIRSIKKWIIENEENSGWHSSRIKALNQNLTTQSSSDETKKWVDEISKLQLELNKMEENWIELSEKKDVVQKKLDTLLKNKNK